MGAACNSTPALSHTHTPRTTYNNTQGATNNKRLLTATGTVTFQGRRDAEVFVMGSWSGWADAQRMLWSDSAQRWECPLALPVRRGGGAPSPLGRGHSVCAPQVAGSSAGDEPTITT